MVQDEDELTDDGLDDDDQERDEGSLAEDQEVVDDLSTSTLEVRKLLRRCSGKLDYRAEGRSWLLDGCRMC